MRRWCVMALFFSMSVGCKTTTPLFGPGQTRIPPPPTGSIGRADPYYRGAKTVSPGDRNAAALRQANAGTSLSPTNVSESPTTPVTPVTDGQGAADSGLQWRQAGQSSSSGGPQTERSPFSVTTPNRDYVDLSEQTGDQVHTSPKPITQVAERDLLGPTEDFVEITEMPANYSGVARRPPRIRGFRYANDRTLR